MRFSILSLAPILALAAAVAVPAPEVDISKRASTIPQVHDIHPAAYQTIPELAALSEAPAGKSAAAKRDAEADAEAGALSLDERTAPFNYVLSYLNYYGSSTQTYYWLPYVYNTCFSFAGTNLDNQLSALNIYSTSIYCYFFVNYDCSSVYYNGYTFAYYYNTPLNAGYGQNDNWSSYICY